MPKGDSNPMGFINSEVTPYLRIGTRKNIYPRKNAYSALYSP